MKVRVKENIGRDSLFEFGTPGTAFEVKEDGMIMSFRGMDWCAWSEHECTIEALNRYFGVEDQYQTVFELVEE